MTQHGTSTMDASRKGKIVKTMIRAAARNRYGIPTIRSNSSRMKAWRAAAVMGMVKTSSIVWRISSSAAALWCGTKLWAICVRASTWTNGGQRSRMASVSKHLYHATSPPPPISIPIHSQPVPARAPTPTPSPRPSSSIPSIPSIPSIACYLIYHHLPHPTPSDPTLSNPIQPCPIRSLSNPSYPSLTHPPHPIPSKPNPFHQCPLILTHTPQPPHPLIL